METKFTIESEIVVDISYQQLKFTEDSAKFQIIFETVSLDSTQFLVFCNQLENNQHKNPEKQNTLKLNTWN
jgi:hypothetical protein